MTAREFAVARIVTEELTNAEIATDLSIAPRTASSHVEHTLAKLGASRRAEIAAWAPPWCQATCRAKRVRHAQP